MRKLTGNPRSPGQQETRNRALHVLARMRRTGVSLTDAARQEHIDPRTVRRYLGNRLHLDEPDLLTREMFVITALGPVPVSVRGSVAASQLGKHAAAVQHYLRTGDRSALVEFQGKRVGNHELIVDTELLSTLLRPERYVSMTCTRHLEESHEKREANQTSAASRAQT
jgi:hypothetical protein